MNESAQDKGESLEGSGEEFLNKLRSIPDKRLAEDADAYLDLVAEFRLLKPEAEDAATWEVYAQSLEDKLSTMENPEARRKLFADWKRRHGISDVV